MRMGATSVTGTLYLLLTALFASHTSTSTTFNTLEITKSAEGKATCMSGIATVDVHATNIHFDLAHLTDQFVVTDIVQRLFEVNSTFVKGASKGRATIKGSFNISASLCYPSKQQVSSSVETVQVLSHGLGLDKTYWDIAAGYSYIDAAAAAGYATFAFDRLGVGSSDHPDPTAVVQSTVHVEVLHALINGLKNGDVGHHGFQNVVGVGHSYGSIIQVGHDVKYPNDCSAIILTGVASTFEYLPTALLSNDPTMANTVRAEYAHLMNGYLLTPTGVAYQEPFFRWPYFERGVFDLLVENAGTYALGDELTSAVVLAPATLFSGPVAILLGQYDYTFCMGDCTNSGDPAEGFLKSFYPSASSGSTSYIVPDSGHCINAHRTAGQAYMEMTRFLQSNNL